ncbi:hypothetical protein Aperf_G00000036194 [Anoplocephala perfoliata]
MCSRIAVELIGQFGESYPGYLVDYKSPDYFLFRFIGDAAPGFNAELNVSPVQLKKPPNGNQHVIKDSEVAVGDYVDVLVGKSCPPEPIENILLKPGDQPLAWWPARVVKKRGQFIVVEYSDIGENVPSSVDFPKPGLEAILELNQVRPRNTELPLSESSFFYSILDIPAELAELFKEPSYIQHIVRACGPSMLISQVADETVLPPSLGEVDNTASHSVKFLLVFTSAEAKFKAETLAPDVTRMLRQKHAIINQINQLTLRMKENNAERSNDLIYEEFTVDKDLVGHSIGARGANISRARSVDGIVSVTLNPDTLTFRVSGKTQNAVDSAKRLLEYATDTVEVPKEYVGRVIGTKNHQIQALVERVGLARIRVQGIDEATGPDYVQFSITGTRSAINDAKLLINFMIDNFKEIAELEAQLSPMHVPNRGGGRHRGRGDSIQSDNFKGDRKSRAPQTDSGQATDSGVVTTPTSNGDPNNGRGEDFGGNQSDSTLLRRTKRPQRRQNQNRGASGVNGTKPTTSSRKNPLPPPVPQTNESSLQQDGTPDAAAPKSNRRKGGKRVQANNSLPVDSEATVNHVVS